MSSKTFFPVMQVCAGVLFGLRMESIAAGLFMAVIIELVETLVIHIANSFRRPQ